MTLPSLTHSGSDFTVHGSRPLISARALGDPVSGDQGGAGPVRGIKARKKEEMSGPRWVCAWRKERCAASRDDGTDNGVGKPFRRSTGAVQSGVSKTSLTAVFQDIFSTNIFQQTIL